MNKIFLEIKTKSVLPYLIESFSKKILESIKKGVVKNVKVRVVKFVNSCTQRSASPNTHIHIHTGSYPRGMISDFHSNYFKLSVRYPSK